MIAYRCGVVVNKSCILSDLVRRAFNARFCGSLYFHASSSHAQQHTQVASVGNISVPLAKKRDDLSILRALALSTRLDWRAPGYKFIDDPFLIPANNPDKRRYALAKVSGQKAAQYVVNRYPGNFVNDPAEPPIEAFMPPKEARFGADTLEGLQERIDMRQPVAAFESYQILKTAVKNPPVKLVEDLLDLLCVYNSDQPQDLLSDELFFHHDIGQDNTKKIKKVWNDTGAAEIVFKGIEEPTLHMYCSMIRGRAKYYQADTAFDLFQQLRSQSKKLDVKTYNAIIGVAFYLRDNSESRWGLIQEILQDMAASDVCPDVGTFNAVLFVLSRSSRYSGTIPWSLQILNEMKSCNIEPSLTTWSYILHINYAHDNAHSTLLHNIVDYLQGKELVACEPTDYDFFSTAMVKCYVNLKDLKLAYKIEKVLDVGNNRNLLGDSYREALYYTYFLRTLCLFEQIDTIMSYYDKVTPFLYTPTFGVFSDILTALELNDGFKYLPRLWSDLVALQYTRRVDLVEHLLRIMAKQRHDTQLQDLLVHVVNNLCLLAEADLQNRRLTNPLVLTGCMYGCMSQIHMFADNFEQAWAIFEQYAQSRQQINGFPSETSLVNLAELCIQRKEVDKTLQVLSMMSDFAYPKLDGLIVKAKSSLDLTEHQQSHLDDL